MVRKKTTAAIVRSSGGGKVSSGWFGASTARCLQNKQQPSGYVDAWMRRARQMRTLRLVHAVMASQTRRDVDAGVARTSVNMPDPPCCPSTLPMPRDRYHRALQNCGGGVLVVLHVIPGSPLAATIAWSAGTGRAISGPDALDLPRRRTNMLAATGPGEKCGERRVKGLDVTHSRHARQVIDRSAGRVALLM